MTLVLGACALSAAGQQVDGDFDGTWDHCTPWDSKNGYYSKLDKSYIQPENWTISNVSGMGGMGATLVGKQIAGHSGKDGDWAVELTNQANPYMSSQIVPAYITLGTSWATASVSGGLTGITVSKADGGSFGGKNFSFKPDAISFYCKRSLVPNSTEKASVIVYLWKGTYTQKNVPGNTAFGNPTKGTMTDRDRQILGISMEGCQGGTTSATTDAKCIAKLNETIDGEIKDWTLKTYELKYLSDETPEKINIILAADDYFADRSGITVGNTLTVDDVKLIYYHALSSLSYDGTDVANFDPETTEYDLSDVEYDADKLSYEKKGAGAVLETSYDEESAVLSITVKGNNYVEGDEDTFTTYTIRFKKPSKGIETEYQNGLYIDARSLNSGEQFDKNKTIKLVNYPDLNNRYDLLLNDFIFYMNGMALPVGDILVKDLDKTQEGGKLHLTAQSQQVEIEGLGTSLPISVDATLENNELTAKIAIEGLNINVTFAPAYNLTEGVSIPTTSLSNLQFTRSFKSGWNTLILPFATTAAQLGAEEVDQLSSLSTDHNWVNFEKVESGELAANVPYLVKFADAKEVTLYYGGEVTTAGNLTTTASATSGNGQVSYVGNYVASMDMNGKYGLYEDQIVQGGTNALLPSTACYFDFKNVANPAALSVKFGNGETTSISTITAPAATQATGVYNLQGVKLNNTGSTAGLPAGLYIVNGQKVLVK